MRVLFKNGKKGNGNIALHTVTETLHTNTNGSGTSDKIQPKFNAFRSEML